MPAISQFYGIVIKLFFADQLPAHFHAEYQSYKAQISIRTGNLMEGELPAKQLKLIQAWAILHEEELLATFESLRLNPATWKKIRPLE
jgi:hypothetical protein